jgi:hypothetical protein
MTVEHKCCHVINLLSLAVSLRISRFNIQNSTWCPHCVECFVRISEQTATFVLYVINWLIFINVVESVYSAVRTDSLYKAEHVSL